MTDRIAAALGILAAHAAQASDRDPLPPTLTVLTMANPGAFLASVSRTLTERSNRLSPWAHDRIAYAMAEIDALPQRLSNEQNSTLWVHYYKERKSIREQAAP